MKVIRKVTVEVSEVNFTANQWQLYTIEKYADTCDEVATKLNLRLQTVVNTGATRRETEKEMHRIMNKHSADGAADSEPYWFLERLLDEIYGQEEHEHY